MVKCSNGFEGITMLGRSEKLIGSVVLSAGLMVSASGKNVTMNAISTGKVVATMNDDVLLGHAKTAMNNSYSPYSKFKVGCALLTDGGKIYHGCNVENASYRATICAECVAFAKAVSEGERKFQAVSIVSSGGDFTYPCGICRQMMSEFNINIKVILESNGAVKTFALSELLPHSFNADQLDNNNKQLNPLNK